MTTYLEEHELLLLALGNAGLPASQSTVADYLADSNPALRGAAVLALRKLPVNTVDSILIASLTHDANPYVQEMAAAALTQRTLTPALRTAEAEGALQAYTAVTAAAVDGVFTRNWDKRFSAGPVAINLPGDLTVKSAPDAPALTLDANQYAKGSVMGINFNLFHAKLLSDVPAGARRVGAYFWIGNNTLVWKDEANVPCSFAKNGTLWQGSKQFFSFNKRIPVYSILIVDLHAEATGYAKITYDYRHQLCAANAATASGTITPQVHVSAKGSAYLSLVLLRGGVVLTADILKTSLPARVSASLSQSGSTPPVVGACVDVKATIEPLSGKLEASAQRRKYIIGGSWKSLGTWNIWSYAVNSQNYTLWSQCWPEAPGAFSKLSPANNATNIASTVTLSWQPATGAGLYGYCIDTTLDNTCDRGVDNYIRVSGTSVTLALEAGKTYQWQARAYNATGIWTPGNGSGVWWSFITSANGPGTFSKLNPANSATNISPAVVLTWQPATNAVQYGYCIDTTLDNVCDRGVDNFIRVSGTSVTLALETGKTYQWQARAYTANGAWTPGNGSGQWWSFTTDNAPAPFNKTYPGSNATNVPTSIDLTWTPSVGAVYYMLCIDTTADLLCNGSGDNTNFTRVNGTSYRVNLAPNITYSWQVRAVSTSNVWTPGNGSGQWWGFTTRR